jgi:signal transduction histidine kinase
MELNSVRVRLTLWNVLLLALVLGGFGAVFFYSVQADQATSIDRQLADRVHGMTAQGLPGGPGGEAFRQGAGAPDEHRQPGSRPVSSAARPRRFNAAVVRGDLYRPRFFNLQGKAYGPFWQDHPWDPVGFAGAAAGRESYSTVIVEGERLRVFSTPLRSRRVVTGVIQAAHPLAEHQHLVESHGRTLLMLLPLALLTAGLGGILLTNRALRPVRDITEAAARIEADNLSARLPVAGRDEFAQLAGMLNGMLGRLEAAFERQRQFTGDASHELRTPLATIKATTSLAREDEWGAEECRRALGVVEGAADRAQRLVDDLLLLARADSGRLRASTSVVALEDLLCRALRETEAALPDHVARPQVLLKTVEGTDPLWICCHPDHMVRVFINLLENALRHTPATGTVRITARRNGTSVTVRIADTGEGISPEHLPHLGERFYRVDTSRARMGQHTQGGAGLGLAICKTIVQAHQGDLRIRSRAGVGTTVTVRLPLETG